MASFDELREPMLPLIARADGAAPGKPGQPSYIAGHRKRLNERFLEGGPKAMPDYEVLEMLLFRALPRGDVKPLAHKLLKIFGNLTHVIAAPPDRLRDIKGVGDSVILEFALARELAERMARSKILQREVLSSWDALLDYCHTSMSHNQVEQFRVLYLDRKNLLIADEEQARGTVDHVPVYPREVMKRALQLDATALILVHNHPSGDPTPSQADIDMTERMDHAAMVMGLTLHDHVIIGKSRELSFRAEGLLTSP